MVASYFDNPTTSMFLAILKLKENYIVPLTYCELYETRDIHLFELLSS